MDSVSASNNTTIILKEWIRNPLLISTALLGIVSNIILLISIASMKRLQDSYYSFVINIVIADLATSVLTFMNPLIKLINKDFYTVIGGYYCKFFYTFFCASYITAGYNFALLSLYRLKMISDPANFRLKSIICKHGSLLMIFSWIISFLFSFPVNLITRYDREINAECDIFYPYGQIFNIVYFVSISVIGYSLSVLVTTSSYALIASKITSRIGSLIVIGNIHSKRSTWSKSNEAHKFLALATAVYVVFSWPFIASLSFLAITNQTQAQLTVSNVGLSWILTVAFFFSFLTCILNPILFLTFDRNVRTSLHKICNKLYRARNYPLARP